MSLSLSGAKVPGNESSSYPVWAPGRICDIEKIEKVQVKPKNNYGSIRSRI